MLKKHWKGILVSIIVALLFGFLGSILGGDMNNYTYLNKPWFSPPSIVFPIVWTILYVLMGLASYMVYQSDTNYKTMSLSLYIAQLIVNSLWTLFFFRLEWRLFAFIWLLFLIVLVIATICKFYKISKVSAYLLVPYLIWLIFAAILNYSIYFLN
ncbi:MAG: tryptophan-rich sensory protein [Lachnospiraceae bacterium]|jgi:tryptophan-rich sensory protein|nr:tryptophan-rich sensory protein [Lachnospiraceae bacterium]